MDRKHDEKTHNPGSIGERREPPIILPENTDESPDIVKPGPAKVPDGQTVKDE